MGFFRRKSKPKPPEKPVKKIVEKPVINSYVQEESPQERLLTAEGWRRRQKSPVR